MPGFNSHIRSILSENCYFCHGPDSKERKAGLRLDTREGALAVITPGDADDSELIARITSSDAGDVMPPPESGRKLTAEQRDLLRRWIEGGAEYERHWAFETRSRPTPPAVEGEDWVRNDIDRFVLRRLEKEGLAPSPEAGRRMLIRRLSLDLTGLPPTPGEVEEFLSDHEDGAYVRLVERLLASPHYGERMALEWLDAARYADSNGFQQDGDRHSYIWRDWVVRALNDNKPFDQFTIEQLAGDLLDDPTQDQLIATSFNRNHMLNGEGGAIAEEQRNNVVFDRVDTTSTIWLGLTMACAQCHDHKYDPVSQHDYYRFFAYFNNVPESGKVDRRLGRLQYANPVLKIASDEQEAEEKRLEKERFGFQKFLRDEQAEIDKAVAAWWNAAKKPDDLPDKLDPVRDRAFETLDGYNTRFVREEFLRRTDESEWREAQVGFDRTEKELQKLRDAMQVVMVMEEREETRPTHVLDRGDYESPLEPVTPGLPAELAPDDFDGPPNRLGLARWLVDPENPLTARVIVNRQWQRFFGIGIVKTSEDFGVQAEDPTHPELLDWLASEFVESGWNVKHMHRLIVTSATYRQTSRADESLWREDPENRLVARATRFRLPSLVLRDQALAFAGLLRPDIGGAPVYPYQPDGLWHEFSYEKFRYHQDEGDKLYRRSLYTFWRRTVAPTTFFDTANRQICSVRKSRTNTPLHALVTLNDPAYVEAARIWAEAMVSSPSEDPVAEAFVRATGREPSEEERRILARTLGKARDYFASHRDRALDLLATGDRARDESLDPVEVASHAQVAQLILNLDEVLNRE